MEAIKLCKDFLSFYIFLSLSFVIAWPRMLPEIQHENEIQRITSKERMKDGSKMNLNTNH